MIAQNQTRCTAFAGNRLIATGELSHVARKTRQTLDRGEKSPILVFDDSSSEQIEVDFRGTIADVLRRLKQPPATRSADEADPLQTTRGRGRPKLGVVAREVTLLPRHWQWLGAQPGGTSVALRKLVEEARRTNQGKDRVRRAQEVSYRFMSAMAGNLPGFEEATRALFASNAGRFDELIKPWPPDVREHVQKIASAAF